MRAVTLSLVNVDVQQQFASTSIMHYCWTSVCAFYRSSMSLIPLMYWLKALEVWLLRTFFVSALYSVCVCVAALFFWAHRCLLCLIHRFSWPTCVACALILRQSATRDFNVTENCLKDSSKWKEIMFSNTVWPCRQFYVLRFWDI